MSTQVKALHPKNLETSLGNTLNHLMQKSGIDGVQLSKATGIPVTTINRLRNVLAESNPTLSTLIPLANYFGVSVSQLIGDEAVENYETASNSHVKTAIQAFPLLSWNECIDYKNVFSRLNTNNSDRWIVGEPLTPTAFAVTTKPAMQPRFSEGTILIINPEVSPKDGNIVVVHYPNTQEATLRQLVLDGPVSLLCCINPSKTPSDTLTEDIKIIGIVCRTMFSFD